jgi:hypothetical protein
VVFIAVLYMIGGPLAFIPLFMLPVMIIIGLGLQFPLERAMRKLQAESAARHGVLVESLAGIETVRATGAEARMQNAWERSVAATARSGEEVHHWSSLALTTASTAQQLNYLADGHHRRVSHSRRQDHRWRAGCFHHAVRTRARPYRRDRDRHYSRCADLHHAQGHQPDHATRERAPAGTPLCGSPHREGQHRLRKRVIQISRLQRRRA